MNDMIQAGNGSRLTMSSREIAEVTGKAHGHVLRDIRAMLVELYPSCFDDDGKPVLDALESKGVLIFVRPDNGQTGYVRLQKRESLVLISGYSIEMRAKIIDRWQELEAAQSPSFNIPQTYSAALRLCADQAEQIEAQQAQIEAAKPAVAFVERYVEARSSKSLSDVAKVLGWKPHAFIERLAADEVVFKRGGSWIAFQHHVDVGRFTLRTGESNGHAFVQTRVEPKGIEWLAAKYGVPSEAKGDHQ